MSKAKNESESIFDAVVLTSEFAQLVGKTPQWIRQLTRDGVLTQCDRGKYHFGQNLLAYIEYASGGKVGDDDRMTHADIKAEHEMLKKEKTELQLQQLRGQLHDANDVRSVMGDMILSAKSKFLSLPVRISPQLEGESAKVIEKKLHEEVTEILKVLVDYTPQQFTETKGSE